MPFLSQRSVVQRLPSSVQGEFLASGFHNSFLTPLSFSQKDSRQPFTSGLRPSQGSFLGQSGIATWLHSPLSGLQLSVVHSSPSLQALPLHLSSSGSPESGLPGSSGFLQPSPLSSSVKTHPELGSQLSVVHFSPSLHVTA